MSREIREQRRSEKRRKEGSSTIYNTTQAVDNRRYSANFDLIFGKKRK
jgi:hypothetical protein